MDEENEVMYVTCLESQKLVKARLNGMFTCSIDSMGSGRHQLFHSMGLCQDVSGDLYVADTINR